MGSNTDRITSALDAGGPMTARQISRAAYGDETDSHVGTIRRGIQGLLRFEIIQQIGVVMGGQRQTVYWFTDRPIPELPPEVSDTMTTRQQQVYDVLAEYGPMTAQQVTEVVCGDVTKSSKDSIWNTLSRLYAAGEITRSGNHGAYVYEVAT